MHVAQQGNNMVIVGEHLFRLELYSKGENSVWVHIMEGSYNLRKRFVIHDFRVIVADMVKP